MQILHNCCLLISLQVVMLVLMPAILINLLQPRIETKLQRILAHCQTPEKFIEEIISSQIQELKRAIFNLQHELALFEQKYKILSIDFYEQYQQGILDDREDFMLWAGSYELFLDNQQRLVELQND